MKKVNKTSKKEEIPILKKVERLKNTKMKQDVFDFVLKKLITMEDSTLYVKKPIPIKAFDFLETKKDNEGNNLFDGIEDDKYFINTLEGKMFIKEDDFIIIGIKGEKYPIKRDIFFETYKKYIPKNKNNYINR